MVVRVSGDHVYLLTPYHEDLPPRARSLGGKWDPKGKRWAFPAHEEQRVRDLACEIFGDEFTYKAGVYTRDSGYNPHNSGVGIEKSRLTREQVEEFVQENVQRFQAGGYEIREVVIKKER